ncbi:MAG: carbohydrate kinase [Bryobacterales bacterium]|nr:carbohydrate kinase [Bryobacterales bacterium]
MQIVSLGEILWDVFPDGHEALGGATFNFAFHAARLGHDSCFVSAVGDDPRGHKALRQATRLGMDTDFIATHAGFDTGTVAVTLDAERQPSFLLRRPAAYDRVTLTDAQIARIAALRPAWICFGTLTFVTPHNRATLRRLLEACPDARRFYDVNLRPDNWSEALVRELLPLAHAVKLNAAEHVTLAPVLASLRADMRVCVTLADRGCVIDGVEVPGLAVKVADAVGAGDAFSAALVHGLAQGWDAARIGAFANRVGALVVSRPGGTPFWSPEELGAA